MFDDGFKDRYTTIPFAIYRAYLKNQENDVLLHQHKETELISMTEGEADFYVNTKFYRLKKGDVLVIPPYALHKVHISASPLCAYYCICFDSEMLCDEEIKSKLEGNQKHMISNDESYAPLLYEQVENAFLACEKAETGWELSAMGNIFLMFGILKENGFFSQTAEVGKDTNFGKAVMTYILENYMGEPTSRSAASALYMNNSYFCRLFKKTFGCPFSNYLLAYRLEKAKTYLSGTDLSITEIALKIGINNCSYFCKTFKERFNLTPLEYRKNSASEDE